MPRTSNLCCVIALLLCTWGCSDRAGTASRTTEETGQASLAITSTPADAQCVEVTVQGARTVVQQFAVTPGSSALLPLTGLPVGSDQFSGRAFNLACGSYDAGSVPTWIAAAVGADVSSSAVTNVTLDFVPNGQASVTANFDADDAGAADGGDGGGDGGVVAGSNCTSTNGSFCITSFTASATSPALGANVTFTATVNSDVGPSPWFPEHRRHRE